MFILYGDESGLANSIANATEIFKKENIGYVDNCYIYMNYPCEKNNDDTFEYLKLLIVSKKGLFYVTDDKNNKRILRSEVYSKCYMINSLGDKIDDDVKVINVIDPDELVKLHLDDKPNVIDENELDEFNSLFQRSKSLTNFDSRLTKKNNSLGFLIKERNNRLNIYDGSEFNIIYSNRISTHMRIRGIAGSGKTIVLAKKMAYMHYRFPECKMCYVFFTISLKQFVSNLFLKFYKEISGGLEYNKENVVFYHSWGNRKYVGFYSNLCDIYHVEKKPLYDEYGNMNSFNSVCSDLLNNLPSGKLGVFDYVFIDEAQDFGIPFFNLVMKSLNSEGKIIYAYDELQTLSPNQFFPTKHEIFGNEPCEDNNLPICYRTPKEILVAAHAIGMGIYSDDKKDLCNIPEDLTIWEAIGYNSVSGIKYDSNVNLFREPSKIDSKIDEPVVFKIVSDKTAQASYVCKEVYNLISKQDVLMDDIMIIDLDSSNYEDNFVHFKSHSINYLNRIAAEGERLFNYNLVFSENAAIFRLKGSIPYTSVFRAKGNEANIVFILNADKVSSLRTVSRNRLFTAMTRSKFRVYILGTNEIGKYSKEYNIVKSNDYHLIFDYPSSKRIKELRTIAKNEEQEIKNAEKAIEYGKKIKDDNLKIDMLLNQFGYSTIEELIKFLDEKK